MNHKAISFWVIVIVSIVYCKAQKIDYNKVCENLNAQRNSIKSYSDEATKYSTSANLLYTSLTDSIFPSWYGTPWDFNGISNTPGKGEIACGYFVSTTLKHVGFNLNRYKLAQQGATAIIKAIAGKASIKTYTNPEALINSLKAKPNGLYAIGLDYHVGFLAVYRNEVYFVHSDYISDKVVREKALQSEAFLASGLYILGNLTGNKIFINNWLNNTKVY